MSLIEAARAATFDDWLKAHYIKCGFISSTTELRLAWDAALAAAPAQVPLTDEPWRKLYLRAINEANGLTNYVEDRPELRSAEKRISKIEDDARAIERAHGIGGKP